MAKRPFLLFSSSVCVWGETQFLGWFVFKQVGRSSTFFSGWCVVVSRRRAEATIRQTPIAQSRLRAATPREPPLFSCLALSSPLATPQPPSATLPLVPQPFPSLPSTHLVPSTSRKTRPVPSSEEMSSQAPPRATNRAASGGAAPPLCLIRAPNNTPERPRALWVGG